MCRDELGPAARDQWQHGPLSLPNAALIFGDLPCCYFDLIDYNDSGPTKAGNTTRFE
jgi:hypothetical protein